MELLTPKEQTEFERLVNSILQDKTAADVDAGDLNESERAYLARRRMMTRLLQSNRDGIRKALEQCVDPYVQGALQALVDAITNPD